MPNCEALCILNVDMSEQWRAQASGGAGAKWHYEGTIADREGGGGGVSSARGITIHDFITLVFLFCKLFEHYSQTNFSIIKTKPFKVTKYKQKLKKYGRYLGQSG